MVWESKQNLFFIKIIILSSLPPAVEQWDILVKGAWAGDWIWSWGLIRVMF